LENARFLSANLFSSEILAFDDPSLFNDFSAPITTSEKEQEELDKHRRLQFALVITQGFAMDKHHDGRSLKNGLPTAQVSK